MKPRSNQSGHSAEVRIRLLLHDSSLPVSQLGPDFLFLGVAIDEPPGEGTLILRVDQSERRWRVRLPEGISSASKRVTIANAA